MRLLPLKAIRSIYWMKNQMKPYFLDAINSESFRTSSLIDSARVKKRIEAVVSGAEPRFSFAEKTWKEFVPYLWEKAMLRRDYTLAH